MDAMKAIGMMIEPLRRRISSLVGRAIIEAVTDSGDLQTLKITTVTGETLEGLQRVGTYGLASVPQAGAEAVILSLGGNREHSIVIACEDRRYRLKGLADGEVALYSDEGDKIILKRGNKIEITTETFTVNTTKAEIKNTQGEFFATVAATLDAIMAAKTATSIGLQPLVSVDFPALKTKLDSFKV
jgi:phage baseplate assembly protein V